MVTIQTPEFLCLVFYNREHIYQFHDLKAPVKDMVLDLGEHLFSEFQVLLPITSVYRNDPRSQHFRYEAVDAWCRGMSSEVSNYCILFCLTNYPRQDIIILPDGRKRNALSIWPHGRLGKNHLHLSQDKS